MASPFFLLRLDGWTSSHSVTPSRVTPQKRPGIRRRSVLNSCAWVDKRGTWTGA
jgi:hypothetical protein